MADPATRPYRTEIPNLIDDLDLSVYAFRLYAHIKRVAGANGTCYEGTRKLSEKCKMSAGQVSKAKKELLDKGLVIKGSRATNGGETDELTPVDIWQQNYDAFTSQGVHIVNTFDEKQAKGVHTVNEGVHTVNEGVHTVNGRRNQEEGTKKKSESAKAPRPARTETQKPLNFAHEAVQIFKQLTGVRNVAPAMADRIAETVVDFPAWRDAVSNWLAAGFKPNNIGGMLDWYLHPDRQKRERKNDPKPPPKTEYYQSQAHKYPPEEERRRLLVEGLARRTAIRNVGDS